MRLLAKYRYLFLVCFVTISAFDQIDLYSQDELDNDDPWDLENLDRSELDSITSTEVNTYYNSHGWLPSTWGFRNTVGLFIDQSSLLDYTDGGVVFREGSDIGLRYRDGSLPEFETRNLYEPLDIAANQEIDNDFGPIRESFRYGLISSFATGLPLFIELEAVHYCTTSILYNRVNGRAFRDRTGDINYFNEGNYLVAESEGIGLGVTAKIPLYGAFIEISGIKTMNIYSMYIGLNADISLSHRVYQYSQIENNRGLIRYSNSRDTVWRGPGIQAEDFNDIQTSIPFGVSWDTGIGPITFGMMFGYAINLTTVLEEQQWRSDRVNLRIYLGFDIW